jgi:hypothetical protein
MGLLAEGGWWAEICSTKDEHAREIGRGLVNSHHGSYESDARICCAILCLGVARAPPHFVWVRTKVGWQTEQAEEDKVRKDCRRA